MKKLLQLMVFGFINLTIPFTSIFAQDTLSFEKKILVRDSLDYLNKPLSINTTSNEFSPIPFKGGLLYISNKPIPSLKASFNKVYWSKDPNFNIVDSALYKEVKKDTALKYYRKGKSDDFTAPTSNDNDILVRYKKLDQNINDIEMTFLDFSTEQVFAYDERTNLIIYAKKGGRLFSRVKHWELWQATLTNGILRNKSRLNFGDRLADYLHPFINEQGTKLYFASNITGGKGGYDLYYVPIDKNTISKDPIALEGLNSIADDIMPSVINDTFFFSSNKEGGLGGFDAYVSTHNSQVQNMGYPINTNADDIGVKKFDNEFYLSSNRNGNFDIIKLKHEPSNFTIKGNIVFSADSTSFVSQSLTIKDQNTGEIIEKIKTDEQGNYVFNGKPNRTYEMLTVNGNGVIESFIVNTDQTKSLLASDKLMQKENAFKYNFPIKVGGTSIKQKSDSIRAYIVKAQKRIEDSINNYTLNSKFVVHYEFNKHSITSNERLVLDSLINKLAHLSNTKIVVGSFTDCIGSYDYNYRLSVNRAKEVVAYLIKNGVEKKNIVITGYSKKYNLAPCSTKYAKINKALKDSQQTSRRSEIVLSETTQTTWAKLENERGPNYYTIYDANNLKKPTRNLPLAKQLSIAQKVSVVRVNKVLEPMKVTVAKVNVAPVVKKDTVAKVKLPAVVKKDTVAKLKVTPVVKKDTVAKVKLTAVAKKDTVAKVKIAPVVKKDTVASKESKIQKVVIDSALNTNLKSAKQNIKTIVAKSSNINSDQLSKEQIVKALDSLAKLKLEQERIVNYLTLRINNKPIDVYVSSDSVTVEIYDNAVHDKDSVSVIYNSRIVVDRQELKVNKPIQFKLKVSKDSKLNELIIVAENLGSEPPNTAVMFITEKSGRQQQVILNTDMTHNGVVYFIKISKK